MCNNQPTLTQVKDTLPWGGFPKLMIFDKSTSWHPVRNHLHCTQEFDVCADCFLSSPPHSFSPETISASQIVDDSINHMMLNLERMLKLLIRKSRYCTHPIAKDTFFCMLVIIMYAFFLSSIRLSKPCFVTLLSWQGWKIRPVDDLHYHLVKDVDWDRNLLCLYCDNDDKCNDNLVRWWSDSRQNVT